MHSYGEIIVDVTTTMTLDLNADIYVILYRKLGDKFETRSKCIFQYRFQWQYKEVLQVLIRSDLKVNLKAD